MIPLPGLAMIVQSCLRARLCTQLCATQVAVANVATLPRWFSRAFFPVLASSAM